MKEGAYELAERFARKRMQGFDWFEHRWYYIEGVILKGYLHLAEITGDDAYYRYVKEYVDGLLDEQGGLRGFNWNEYNIDQINMGKILFDLYSREGDPKYRSILDKLYQHLLQFPRTKEGSFWHKDIYPNQVWLDGLYMGQPFLCRYIREFVPKKDYSDTLSQFAAVTRRMYNADKRLYLHAYDESREMFWADKRTGLSLNVWGRACGWHVMAMVDVLELLAGQGADDSALKADFRETIDGLLEYQHESGMWYQVVDTGNRKRNYLESSGTLMIAYALLKGARLGLLPAECAAAGKRAFDGCLKEKLSERDGEILLSDVCKSAGLGGERKRPGTFDYYMSEPRAVNNGHGIGALLLAYGEILRSIG